MNKAEREKEIKRRSKKIRSKEEYDKLYAFLKENIVKRLEKNGYKKCRLFFWLYPENVDERCPWAYKFRKGYAIIYFADKYIYDAIKLRIKRDGIVVYENDEYHFCVFYKSS